MENLPKKQKKIKCPSCSNYMNLDICNNGAYKGSCKVCKTTVFEKEHSQKETYMKIIKK